MPLFTNVLFAIGKEKPISVKYVSSKDGLNVRESPTLNSKKIAALIYASEVTVLETGTEETIDGIKGNWVKIKIPKLSWSQKDLSGWVFGGYLSEKLDEPYVFTDDHTYVYTPLEADVPKGYLFVMGDHRNNSLDSRQFGMVDERAVLGRVLVRLIPFTFF